MSVDSAFRSCWMTKDLEMPVKTWHFAQKASCDGASSRGASQTACARVRGQFKTCWEVSWETSTRTFVAVLKVSRYSHLSRNGGMAYPG